LSSRGVGRTQARMGMRRAQKGGSEAIRVGEIVDEPPLSFDETGILDAARRCPGSNFGGDVPVHDSFSVGAKTMAVPIWQLDSATEAPRYRSIQFNRIFRRFDRDKFV
jgi:hypothetical protein